MQRIRVTAKQLGDPSGNGKAARHHLIQFSPSVALVTKTLTRPGKGGRRARSVAAYVGFSQHRDAMHFAQGVRQRFPAARVELRQPKRLSGCNWEVKVAHSTDSVVEHVVQDALATKPTVGDRISQHLAAVAAANQRQAARVDIDHKPLASRPRPTTVRCGDRLVPID